MFIIIIIIIIIIVIIIIIIIVIITIHNLLNAVLSSVYMIELNASLPSHPEQPRRKTFIHSSRHQRLPSDLLTEGDQNKESNTQEGNSRIQVYRNTAISKESQNPSAATYSDKEYVPSLNPTPH